MFDGSYVLTDDEDSEEQAEPELIVKELQKKSIKSTIRVGNAQIEKESDSKGYPTRI